MQRAIRLHLIDPLYYQSSLFTLSSLVKKAEKADIGYDAAIRYSYSFQDEKLELKQQESGERNGYTEAEKAVIESGGRLDRKENEDMEIPASSYLFEQLPFIPEEADLPRIILPYLEKRSGTFFLRLYKENILECVVQLLFPSP